MSISLRFDELLDAIEKLPIEDQERLISILERRGIAQRRAVLAREIQEARKEFQEGACRPVSAAELMKDILS